MDEQDTTSQGRSIQDISIAQEDEDLWQSYDELLTSLPPAYLPAATALRATKDTQMRSLVLEALKKQDIRELHEVIQLQKALMDLEQRREAARG